MTIVAEPLDKQQCDTPEDGRQAYFDAKDSLGGVQKLVVTRDTLTLYGAGYSAITLQGIGFKCSRVTNEIILDAGFGGSVLGVQQLTAVVVFPGNIESVTAEKVSRAPSQPGVSRRCRLFDHCHIRVTSTTVGSTS